MAFTKREVVTEKMLLTLKIELNQSLFTAEQFAERLQHIANSFHNKEFSGFIVMLLRESKASTYEIKSVEVDDCHTSQT